MASSRAVLRASRFAFLFALSLGIGSSETLTFPCNADGTVTSLPRISSCFTISICLSICSGYEYCSTGTVFSSGIQPALGRNLRHQIGAWASCRHRLNIDALRAILTLLQQSTRSNDLTSSGGDFTLEEELEFLMWLDAERLEDVDRTDW